MADLLNRSLAPVSDEAWSQIDDLARQRLQGHLSARKIVDFDGPRGFDCPAVGTGRAIEAKEHAQDGLIWGRREVIPLAEVRAPFALKLDDIENVARGAKDVDWSSMEEAARRIAAFEETAVYKGLPDRVAPSILGLSPHQPLPLSLSIEAYQQAIGDGIQLLLQSGIQPPYHLVAGTRAYKPLNFALPSGRGLRSLVQELIGGNVLWSPSLDGAVLLSNADNYYELTVGQDLAIGFDRQQGRQIELFFIESFAFRVNEPAAAVGLNIA